MGVRFPNRIAFPCFFMLILYSTLFFNDVEKQSKLAMPRVLSISVFIVFLIFISTQIAKSRIEHVETLKKVKAYMDHSVRMVLEKNGADSIIVNVSPHLMPPNYFPLQENDVALKTKILLGGWFIGSPAYLAFLQEEHLGNRSTVVSSMINNRQVILRFWDSAGLLSGGYLQQYFLPHLRQRYQDSEGNNEIEIKILSDFRHEGKGLIYFQLVTDGKISSDVGRVK